MHAYTIRDDIADQHVLGFKVDFETTLTDTALRESYLPKYFAWRYPEWHKEKIENRIKHMTADDMDDAVSPSVYDGHTELIRLVVKDVSDNWQKR